MTASHSRDETTQTIELKNTCSSAVALAAVGLVSIKEHIDNLCRTAAGSSVVSQIFPEWRGYGSPDPHSFAARVIPFYWYARSMSSLQTNGKRYKALVPTAKVIGDSWRWSPSDLSETEQMKVLDKVFSAFEESTPAHAKTECAQYTHIKQLGIVLAHEGKNRVALFRERALPHIPALVSEEEYPASERLRIFELPGVCVSVLDGRFVERVVAIHLVRGLMEAYGVSVEKRWPSEFAELQQVLADLDDTSMRHSYRPYATDMDKLKLDEACRETDVKVTLMDVEAVRLPTVRTFLYAGAALAVLILVTKLTADRWPELQLLFGTAIGALAMLLVAPQLPLIHCKVRHLKSRVGMGHFLQIRQRSKRTLRDTADLGG